MLRPQYGDLFASRLAYIEEIIFLRFPHHAMHYDSIFKVKDTNRAYEEVTGLTGLGLFVAKPEAEAVTFDSIYQTFDKRWTQTTYASGVQFSMEVLHYDLDGKFQQGAEALGRAGNVSAEMTVWSVINNMGTTEYTPDGKAILSSTHLLGGGGTFDNTISGDLTMGGLEDAFNKFADMVDDRGLLIAVQPSLLVIPAELRYYAQILLGSELNPDVSQGPSGSTSGYGLLHSGTYAVPTGPMMADLGNVNAINPFRNAGLSFFVSPYLTDSDQWFLMGSKDESPFRVWWGIRPTPDHTVDFDTGNAKSKLVYALAAGCVDWRPIVGSTGG